MAPIRKQAAKGSTRVTFTLPKQVEASTASICGDFNAWDPQATEMKRLKDGRFTVTVNLDPGRYRYRFVLDGGTWENDWEAESYVPNEFGGEDSLIAI